RQRGAHGPRVDRVVVMKARRANRIGAWCAVPGYFRLELREFGAGDFRVERQPCVERAKGFRGDATQHETGLGVVLERLADEEVLQEVHARAAIDTGEFETAVFTENVRLFEMRRYPRARSV